MDNNPEALSFDREAARYDRVRPRYPAALFDDLIDLTGLKPGSGVLEIGAGTGIATQPLAERGFAITALEPGPAMAALATRNLTSFPEVDIMVSSFEDWPLPDEPLDLVLSATAFHWLDPVTRYVKSAAALREGGHLAIIEYRHLAGDDDAFFSAAQECYERFVPRTSHDAALPVWDSPPDTSEIDASPFFDLVAVRRFREDISSSRDEYLDLLATHSGNLTLSLENRDRLFDCLGNLIDNDFGGIIGYAYRHELMLARRTGEHIQNERIMPR